MSDTPRKKRKLRRGALNLLFAVCGGVLGEVFAALTKNVTFLSWLGYKVNIGITSPIEINLIIAKFTVGFYFVFCPALILFIILGLAVGNAFLIYKNSMDRDQQ